MRKIYMKLIGSVLSVAIAFSMIIGASYAWLTLSDSPAVNGINVSIGGGNTILLAADLTETVTDADGNEIIVHYPGTFDDNLNLSQYSTYDYLNELAGLSPVSTADGINWILPEYAEETGKLLDIQEFTIDSSLTNANQTESGKGTYAYLDFWVVSPGAEYDLRVATDTKSNEGSFLIELPKAVEAEGGGYTLSDTTDHVASVARVGFLVNSDTGSNEGMELYSRSEGYDDRFKSLLGVYQEAGETLDPVREHQFSIYEPNAVLHPAMEDKNGAYMVTRPLLYDSSIDKIAESDVSAILMAQQNSTWRTLDGNRWLEEIFQASIAGKEDLTAETADTLFYNDYLNGQIAAYVSAGNFFANTKALYSEASLNSGTVPANVISEKLVSAGAADDVIITSLERNTPQRIRMFIWLEGQDADCTNTASVPSSRFSLGIELSGATK